MVVSVSGVEGATAGSSQTLLTCSVSGVDISATDSEVTSVMYTWLRGDVEVQAASTLSQYTIPVAFLGVNNAGDVYSCQVAITASYWDVSGAFGGSGSGTLSVNSKSKWLTNSLLLYDCYVSFSTIQFLIHRFRSLEYHL